MPRDRFAHDLDQLEALVQDEAVVVRQMLNQTRVALSENDASIAQAVIVADDEADALYLRIDATVETLLARQAPVARDLRRLLAILHVNRHLERIGDQCVNVAKLVL